MVSRKNNLAAKAGPLLLSGVVAVGAFGAAGTVQAKSTNAQSLSFNITSPQNFILSSEEFWSYNQPEARTYFTNAVSSGPAVTCTGNSTNCNISNKPSAPDPAPEPTPNKLNSPVNNNQCVFWNGGNLSVQPGNSTYTQVLTANGLNGSGNWRFTWTYAVAVASGVNPVIAKTAWNLESETPAAGVPISVSGSLASQSTQNQTGKNARFKTSHTLLDGFGAARLTNAGISLTKLGEPNTVLGTVPLGEPGFPNYSVLQNENFYYLTNAGIFNAPPGLLVLEGWISDIQNGNKLATDGATLDNFPGNDNQGGDLIVFGENDPGNGSPLYLGDIDVIGSYKVTMFGSLKGNPGEIDTGFEGSAQIKVNSSCVAP